MAAESKKRSTSGAKKVAKRLEAVTVRISPLARAQLELLTRALHKPTSGVFEWCIDIAARLVDVPNERGASENLTSVAAFIAHGEATRVSTAIGLAQLAPSLLDQEQRAIFEAIKHSPDLLDPRLVKDEIFGFEGDANSVALHADQPFLDKNFDAFLALAMRRFGAVEKNPITRAEILGIERTK